MTYSLYLIVVQLRFYSEKRVCCVRVTTTSKYLCLIVIGSAWETSHIYTQLIRRVPSHYSRKHRNFSYGLKLATIPNEYRTPSNETSKQNRSFLGFFWEHLVLFVAFLLKIKTNNNISIRHLRFHLDNRQKAVRGFCYL